MTEITKAEVEKIMAKYDRNFSTLQKNAPIRELKTVFKYIADQANKKQRALMDLDD